MLQTKGAEQELGLHTFAAVTAGMNSSPGAACSRWVRPVADATPKKRDRLLTSRTVTPRQEKEASPTRHGLQCSIAALKGRPGQSITEIEVSRSALDGESSQNSSKTWERKRPVNRSNEKTTTRGTARATASGSKSETSHGIADARFGSGSTEKRFRSTSRREGSRFHGTTLRD